MLLDRFLLRSEFTLDTPPEVSPNRWVGMLRWLQSRLTYNDGIDFEQELADEYADYWAWKDEIKAKQIAYGYYCPESGEWSD